MKISKFDIGAEIISIITKGMYPDPKDALREYIQNGIDAKSSSISIKIRQESIVIDDNGCGMNRKVLRDAVRMGVSDKNPSKDVGFMGIGIYSSFHLCGTMTIYSRGSNDIPNILTMDFALMKEILEEQKQKRLTTNFDSKDLIDLQTLLEKCIDLTEEGTVDPNEFPEQGTRVELSKVDKEFYSALSDFDEVSEYLTNVIPLHFDEKHFIHAKEIETEISKICADKNQEFELVDLSLQVNSRKEDLYRPYKDIDFHKTAKPLKPEFMPIESNGQFYGVAWGCLNSTRNKLSNRNIRGFILKKQGFSIGRRERVVKYFPRGNTFFDRYSGEIIIINPKILPNASRDDIEYSPLRSAFLSLLTQVASKFDQKAHIYQEETKADEDLANLRQEVKDQIADYNDFEEDTEVLIAKIVILKRIIDKLGGRISRGGFSDSSNSKANELLESVKSFESSIQARVKELTEKKNKNKPKNKDSSSNNNTTTTTLDIAGEVNDIEIDSSEEHKQYEDLIELITDLEIELDSNLKKLMTHIDELFIQGTAASQNDYYELLQNLKDRFEDDFE